MSPLRRAHDDRLLDALSKVEPVAFEGSIWRVVREGRSPLDGSRGSGRWNPSHLCVLYCSQEPDGALSETFFHLSLGQPVFPSRIRHVLSELRVETRRTLKLANMAALKKLGVDREQYKQMLYVRTQEVGDAAAFLGFDGLIAPSARHACANLVLFLDNIDPDCLRVVRKEPVDWAQWRKRPR